MNIISIVGKTNSGKTTLIERIIPELKKRGYRVGAIKHCHHDFEIDYKEKDSWRMSRAGADSVVIVSEKKFAMIKNFSNPSLDKIIKWLFPDIDFLIVEGYKKENMPKIEVTQTGELLCGKDENLVAVVKHPQNSILNSQQIKELNIPFFRMDEVKKIVKFLEKNFLNKKEGKMREKRSLVALLLLIAFLFFTTQLKSVEISGKSYIQYKNDLTEGKKGNDEFGITRVYLNFKEKVAEKIDFRATTDIKPGKYAGKDNYYIVFMKYLYLTFKDIFPGAELSIGQISRPWIGFEEKIWEHRWVSKVFPDLEGKLSSAGRGLKLSGKIPSQFGEYVIAYINGAGYHTKESGEYNKDISVRLTLQPFSDKGLKLSGLYYSGKYDDTGVPNNNRNRFLGLLSYQSDKFTVAGGFLNFDDMGTKGTGFGGFGILKLGKYSPFLRYETFDPDTSNSNDEHNRLILGISYKIAEKVAVAIDYQTVDYKNSKPTEKNFYLNMLVKY